MMKEKRNKTSPNAKVAILREHLLEDVPVSDLCDSHGLHPTQFYHWQKTLFEKGCLVFESENKQYIRKLERQIANLQAKISGKDEVIAELLGEHMALKKNLGER
jgi:transposase-like protein